MSLVLHITAKAVTNVIKVTHFHHSLRPALPGRVLCTVVGVSKNMLCNTDASRLHAGHLARGQTGILSTTAIWQEQSRRPPVYLTLLF